ncbi:MAG: hypothetical protein ACC663_04275 [Gammaproteobacteria bacterium]
MHTYTPKRSRSFVAALSGYFKEIFGNISTCAIRKTRLLKRSGTTSLFAAMLIAAFNSPLHAQGYPTVYCDAPGANLQQVIDNGAEGGKIFLTGVCND